MSDLYRNADDPLGVAFDVMVPCPCIPDTAPDEDCEGCPGAFPNPAITQECGTCGGSGHLLFDGGGEGCPDCENRGWTFRSSVRVAERVRVVERCDTHGPHICVSAGAVLLHSHLDRPFEDGQTERDITHLWPEHRQGDFRCLLCGEPWPCSACRCPECLGRGGWSVPYGIDRPPGWDDCDWCNRSGTIRTFPKPGELWEIGHRTAELLPVVAIGEHLRRCDAPGPFTPYLFTVEDGNQWRVYHQAHRINEAVDITRHFPTPPEPGQRAGVLGELVLYDQARRVEP